MSWNKNREGLDPTTTKELSGFLGGKDNLTDDLPLYLMMRSDIQTREGMNLVSFLSLLGGHFNSDVARTALNVILASNIGYKGTRAMLIAQVMAQGNIQNEKQSTSFDFSRVEEKD